MEKYRAIPEGYMTVGELAKKMGVTVRTLQHYDKEGLLSPSAVSEGGRRLYTDKDLIKLHQILSLKHLEFSLDEIKSMLVSLDSPAEVAEILAGQAADIQRKIQSLSQAYEEIELLKAEVLQMQSVDFKKYAAIIANLQLKNEYYYLIKHFDEKIFEHSRKHFDTEGAAAFMNNFNLLNDKIAALEKADVAPYSETAQSLAKAFWEMVMEFTKGDMSLLPNLMEIKNINEKEGESGKKQTLPTSYIEKAFDVYFTKLGIDPLKEDSK